MKRFVSSGRFQALRNFHVISAEFMPFCTEFLKRNEFLFHKCNRKLTEQEM
jgi:hypothetical protein